MVKVSIRGFMEDILKLMRTGDWYLTSNPFGCPLGYSRLILVKKDRTGSVTFIECLPEGPVKDLKARFKAGNLAIADLHACIFSKPPSHPQVFLRSFIRVLASSAIT